MNKRLMVLELVLLVVILLVFPALLPLIENISLNLIVRTLLILAALYLVLDLLKIFRPKEDKVEPARNNDTAENKNE